MPDFPEPPRVPSSARHYARAIFELAQEEGSFEGWERRLAGIGRLLDETPLGPAVASPEYSADQRGELARAALSADRELDRPAGNLLLVLIQSRRTRLLAAIREGYRELVNRAQGRLDARLSTALAVSSRDLARFGREISQRLGQEVRFQAQVEPSLLGGAVVRLGDRVFDASLRTRIAQLRQEMLTETQPS